MLICRRVLSIRQTVVNKLTQTTWKNIYTKTIYTLIFNSNMNGLIYQQELSQQVVDLINQQNQQQSFPSTSKSNYGPDSTSPNYWPNSGANLYRPATRPFLAAPQHNNIVTSDGSQQAYSTEPNYSTAVTYNTRQVETPRGRRGMISENARGMSGRGMAAETSRAMSGRHSQETPPSTETVIQDGGRRMSSTASPVGTTPSRGIKRQLDVGSSPSEKRRCSITSSNSDTSPVKSPDDGKMNKVSQVIWEHYLDIRQTEDVFKKKIRLREALYSVLKGVFPYCGLYLVGSSMNGFGTITSDMDMCLMLTQQEVDQRSEAPEVLRIINKSLKKCKFIRNPCVIKAKVPILRFTDTISDVECDLNINNGVGIRNTHLLNAYAQADWRVRPLTMYIKQWAKKQDINDASKASVSSYSLVLMVIHYLQCGVTPCVLPNLQQTLPHKFKETIDVRQLHLDEDLPPFNNSNGLSLGELFLGFLKYYNSFDFLKYGISIRCGEKVPIDVLVRNPKSDPREWKYLCIEEPFLLSNTARSVFDPTIWNKIQRVIGRSFKLLSRSRDLDTIIGANVLDDSGTGL